MFIFAYNRRSFIMFLVSLAFTTLSMPQGNSQEVQSSDSDNSLEQNQTTSGITEDDGTAVTMTTVMSKADMGPENNQSFKQNTTMVGKCECAQSTMEVINAILWMLLQSMAILLMALYAVVTVMQIRGVYRGEFAHCYYPRNAQQQAGIDNVAVDVEYHQHNITPGGKISKSSPVVKV